MRWLSLLLLAACARGEPPSPSAPRDLRLSPIVGERQVLENGEEVRVVRIPSPAAPDERMLDSACLIYKNAHATRIACPSGESPPDRPYGED